MLDAFTAKHLNAWLSAHVHDSERDAVLSGILRLVDTHPDLLDTHSWSEIRRLTER